MKTAGHSTGGQAGRARALSFSRLVATSRRGCGCHSADQVELGANDEADGLARADPRTPAQRRRGARPPHVRGAALPTLTQRHGRNAHSTAIFKGEGTIIAAVNLREDLLCSMLETASKLSSERSIGCTPRPSAPSSTDAPLRRDAARVHGVLRDEARARVLGADDKHPNRPPERICEAGRPRHEDAAGKSRSRLPWSARLAILTNVVRLEAPEEVAGRWAAASLARMASAWRLRARDRRAGVHSDGLLPAPR